MIIAYNAVNVYSVVAMSSLGDHKAEVSNPDRSTPYFPLIDSIIIHRGLSVLVTDVLIYNFGENRKQITAFLYKYIFMLITARRELKI